MCGSAHLRSDIKRFSGPGLNFCSVDVRKVSPSQEIPSCIGRSDFLVSEPERCLWISPQRAQVLQSQPSVSGTNEAVPEPVLRAALAQQQLGLP